LFTSFFVSFIGSAPLASAQSKQQHQTASAAAAFIKNV
jgi:hypothetical protein